MITALWTSQLLLAAIFFATGLTKLTQPRAQLAAGPMGWAADVTDVQFRTVGLLEVLGALGLVLPGALGVAPLLTPLAAVGLALTMVGAIVTHLRMGETDRLAVPIVLLALSLFLALERFGAYSLS
jgi:uncharacterized membrane protein YphA (DoxX/SURF4 family)